MTWPPRKDRPVYRGADAWSVVSIGIHTISLVRDSDGFCTTFGKEEFLEHWTQEAPTMRPHEVEAQKVRESLERAGESYEDCCDRCHYRSVDDEAVVALESLRTKYEEAILALQSLTNPEGHIWHGAHSDQCTGECKMVRAALKKAGAL